MGKDLFVIDTCCQLNKSIAEAFKKRGYGVRVAAGFDGVPDEILAQAAGYTAICIFVNKNIQPGQMEIVRSNGNKLILCCSAGFDNVPVHLCKESGIRIARVPSYSPSSIAEYALSSIFTLAKNLQKSYEQSKQADFSIDSLQGLLLEDKVVGVIGTGTIGKKTAEKLAGLVKKVYCYDTFPAQDWVAKIDNAEYVELDVLLKKASAISIHVPLVRETHHLINKSTIGKMKKDVIIINTSRGEVISTPDLVSGLKSGKVFGAALDVFEGEKNFIFQDMSKKGFSEYPELDKLSKMRNVIISSHVAFYTDESIRQITERTLGNFEGFIGKGKLDESAFVA